ncbi:MAG: hypothetical protein AMJ90_00565 [candidate division Zixibacteria bacterium SM23_73_2]|nr:MAG: hypothetical protein AMJ90_00565 [candidate division Zixibacteria bacterium SM23_73_2]
MVDPLNKKRIWKGTRIFVLFSLLGLTIIFFYNISTKGIKLPSRYDLTFLFVAILLILIDFSLGAFRYRIFFTGEILDKVSFLNCWRANLANIFFGAITPFQTGGGPAQLYIFSRAGVPLAGSISVSLINFFSSLLFLLISAFVAIILIREQAWGELVLNLVRYSFIAFFIAFFLFLALLVKTKTMDRWIQKIIRLVYRILGKKRKKEPGFYEKFRDKAIEFKSYLKFFLQKKKSIFLYSFLLTILLYFNKYLIAYAIVRGMGFYPEFWEVIKIQILQFFFLYFSPTPGASGLGEISSFFLMSKLIPIAQLSIFAFVWRFFTSYVGIGLGGYILLSDLNSYFKEKEKVIPKEMNE